VLTVDDLPPGVTAEIRNVDPGGLVPNTGSSLYIRVRGAAAAGVLDFTLKGTTASHGSASLPFSITITSPPGFPLARVSVGQYSSCGLDPSGKAYCWGDNYQAELGIGTSGVTDQDSLRTKQAAVDTDVRFSKIDVGFNRVCALDMEGKAYCWGSGYPGNGQLVNDPITRPTLIEGDLRFKDIVVAPPVTCGLTTTGAAYCWGGGNGFLGNGTLDIGLVPTEVSGGQAYTAIAGSASGICAVATGGQRVLLGLQRLWTDGPQS
jgi:hypothetical protein